jgi:hypothetical protein
LVVCGNFALSQTNAASGSNHFTGHLEIMGYGTIAGAG